MNRKGLWTALMVLSLVTATVGSVFAAGRTAYGADEPLFIDADRMAWYYPYLQTAVKRGIAEGYGDGSFRPSKTVSYGEFITMAVLHQESSAYEAGEYKGLSSAKHWAETYYYRGLELGYFNEAQISLRQLGLVIPRKDMALIAAGMLGDSFDDGRVADYPDVEKTSPYEYYISLCSSAGVLEGYGDGSFRPEGYLKRCEAVKVVVAALDAKAKQAEGSADSHGGGSDSSDSAPDPLADMLPVDIMPQNKRQILEQMLEGLRFGQDEGGRYFEYDQPDIPSEYHLRVSCRIFGAEKDNCPELYKWQNDYSYRFHPENYNAAAHHVKEYVDADSSLFNSQSPIDDKSLNFIMRIFDEADLEEYANFSIYLDPGRILRLHTAAKLDGQIWQNDEPLPDGMFGW
ncbi:MAG: S-layer homology domain-containing protein [Firmicutes bacterium]|nr:S-layer homology domain-containing protein [Bacillota bacterium]